MYMYIKMICMFLYINVFSLLDWKVCSPAVGHSYKNNHEGIHIIPSNVHTYIHTCNKEREGEEHFFLPEEVTSYKLYPKFVQEVRSYRYI